MTAVRRVVRLAAWVVVLEVRLYRALALWLLRRRPGQAEGVSAVGYARLGSPVIALWIFASATEVVVLHLVVPWHPVRLLLDVVGIWGLVWMLGLMASFRVYPHLVSGETLRLRNGVFADLPVPWSAVATVHTREQEWPSTIRSFQWSDDDQLAIAMSGRTNVVATMLGPTTLLVDGEPRTTSSVAFWVDEPRDFAREHRALLPD